MPFRKLAHVARHGAAVQTPAVLPGGMSSAQCAPRHVQWWGGLGAPNVAIVGLGGTADCGRVLLVAKLFASRGVPAVVCAPEQLEYERGKLRYGAFHIDLVYKRVVINELLVRCDDSHPLISAYLAGDVCLVNSFRCKLDSQKGGAFEC